MCLYIYLTIIYLLAFHKRQNLFVKLPATSKKRRPSVLDIHVHGHLNFFRSGLFGNDILEDTDRCN